MKPRVALMHYTVPPVVGGVEATIGAHARLLADHAYPVVLLAGRGASHDPRVEFRAIPELDSRHPAVERLNCELETGRVPPEFHSLVKELTRRLDAALADVGVLIAHNLPTLHKNLAATTALHRLARTQRVPVVAWCHDLAWADPLYEQALHSGMPWDLLGKRWENVKYVVVSESRRRELAALIGIAMDEIAVVPPGVDVLGFLGIGEPVATWARELGLLDAAPLLLLPARVTRRKNIELGIEIVAALRENGLEPKLIVMGPLGPHNPANRQYWQELRQQAERRGVREEIIFLQEHGVVDDVARRDLYALADALVFPSTREGFGIPLLEAGMARLPIFCADIPPFRETGGDNVHYFALDEAPAAIAARMAAFFAADARYRFKQRVQREYGWERIFTQRIEPLIQTVRT